MRLEQLRERLRQSRLPQLTQAVDLLHGCAPEELPDLLGPQGRGKALPAFLHLLDQKLQQDHALSAQDVQALQEGLNHVREDPG